jgi:serpin B
MLDPTLSVVLRYLRRVPRPGAGDPTDGSLLTRFADDRDEAAFELLLRRHGPMVWNVCRRVLASAGDADDAFQATFLVLVRKARSIAKRDSVASWLHGVAHRVALDARASAARRRAHERGAAMPTEGLPADGAGAEVRQVLDEELRRLPEKYRAPLVLCYLEGKTNDEAACELGCTRGTVAGRLSRARDLLRGRLARRGLALTVTAVATALAEGASPALLPAGLLTTTLKAAAAYAAASAVASPAAAALAEGALRAMFLTKLKVAAAVAAVVVALGAGAGWLWQRAEAEPVRPDPQPAAEPPPAPADDPARAKADDPDRAKKDRPALVEGNTRFACDLYARLRQSEGNVVYSPYSLSTALAMTRAGARGKTAEEMDRVLHFDLAPERLHPAAGALARDLGGADRKKRNYRLTVANALWGQKGYGFLDEFLTLTRTQYGAELTEVDFVGAREEARKTINAAVAKQTQDKVKNLLKPENLTPATRLVLTNAIYFKAEWDSKFARETTRSRAFRVTPDRNVEVPTMAQTAKFNYLEGDTFQLLEMPYAGKDLSMLVLLPKKADGLAELEKALSQEKLAEWQGKLEPATVVVFLPKFKVSGSFELKEVLTAMGMGRAFDSQQADFSGMTGGRDPLFIQDVIHKTFVDVNEEGTEAAGATAVVIGLGGGPPKGATFRADHPFTFWVRDNRSGSVLFVGRVADPTK